SRSGLSSTTTTKLVAPAARVKPTSTGSIRRTPEGGSPDLLGPLAEQPQRPAHERERDEEHPAAPRGVPRAVYVERGELADDHRQRGDGVAGEDDPASPLQFLERVE